MLNEEIWEVSKKHAKRTSQLIERTLYSSLKKHLGEMPCPYDVSRFGYWYKKIEGMNSFDVFKYKGTELFRVFYEISDDSVSSKIILTEKSK